MKKGIIEYGRLNLAEIVAKKTGLTKVNADKAISATLEAIQKLLVEGSKNSEGAKITLRDFGNFETKRTSEKTGTNFQTGEKTSIPAGRRISFKPSRSFKLAVKEAE